MQPVIQTVTITAKAERVFAGHFILTSSYLSLVAVHNMEGNKHFGVL
jgi:hypothetical protein